MIDESTIDTDDLENDLDSDTSSSSDSPLSLEDTIRETVDEVEPKADKPLQSDKSEENKKSIAAANRVRDNTGKFKPGKSSKTSAPSDESPVQAQSIEPLPHWDVSTKEWFNRQPNELKPELIKEFKNREAHTTKLWQDVGRQKERWNQIDRLMNQYVPNWNLKGLSDVQATAEALAFVDLLGKNPQQAINHFMQRTGLTWDQLRGEQQSQQGANQQFQQNYPQQQNNPLQQKVDELYNYIGSVQQQQQQGQINSAVNEIEQLRNEKHPDGRYKWPRLHDANHLSRVQSFVEGIRKTNPSVSWRDATLKAELALQSIDGYQGSPSSSNPKLSQNQADIQRARQASVSVRGRGQASFPAQTQKAKPGEKVEDTIRSVMNDLYGN